MNGNVGGANDGHTTEHWNRDIKMFKKHYGCVYCLYKEQSTTCYSLKMCKIVDYPEIDIVTRPKAIRCHNCSYSNDVGTCFGFCIRAILVEYRKKIRNC